MIFRGRCFLTVGLAGTWDILGNFRCPNEIGFTWRYWVPEMGGAKWPLAGTGLKVECISGPGGDDITSHQSIPPITTLD